ncbi:hypothetical protein PAXRUDRAFT_834410 [Paxillus rubicundulus Ve08.2h10]|uniref:Uncharacterized protein n=1 Tax=Paxillus rubicundulus Ve08.2h10 TaxID=930991 RepID=A0A0D0CSQ0_9AGAM|nr:hypothetical protein PAXRUDRAFT_834582 [Paxillus rubicundulus Ve08.2h10]KIK78860.1 hypothetical protein PAXRUDRAFT_834410 [Paxillus rubicundulus Ve08.2h10]
MSVPFFLLLILQIFVLLQRAIRAHFDAHTELKCDARFEGLFNGRSRGQKRMLEHASDNFENNLPPTNRQHGVATAPNVLPSSPPPNAIAGPSTLAPFSSHNQIHASGSAVPYQHYSPIDFNFESCNYSSATTIPHPYYSTDTYSYHSY